MTPADLQHRLTLTVPEAGQLLGIGRDAAYDAAERGQIPTLRLGRRLVVPVPRLLALLGLESENSEAPVATGAHAQIISLAQKEDQTHGQCPPDPAA